MEKYYRCWKCGNSVTKGEQNKGALCTMPVTYRISGVCGGSLTEEITEQVYNSMIEHFKNKDK